MGNNLNKSDKPNTGAVIRDIFNIAISKGQLPIALVGAFFIIIVWRLPATDLSKFVFEIIDLFVSLHLLGWSLAFIISFGWFISNRKLRVAHTNEIKRISVAKNRSQQKKSKVEFGTSNK